ncbi:linear amide C-N hydrolase [Candidatus Marithrix sp. Canyon 246]|uniref:linear amide C-N hydrolase n=1 Tax=Candidatus Marithrix sp. Canyon 246 TaxID=1827136 RepID=UPI00084A1DAB|nr:choloylglycine hydrolase family protein [Candidatus Marithrix sp. Canyon 246]
MLEKRLLRTLMGLLLLFSYYFTPANACTGILLKAEDKSTVYGRTMEWGTFDLNSRVTIIPRGYSFTGLTPEGKNGKKWETKYGVVGLDMLEKDFLADGINERGLAVGLFYHPGFAKYMSYEKDKARNTITAVDVVAYILTQFDTLKEVRNGMQDIRVVAVYEEALRKQVDAHWIVTEPSGESLIIEYINGELRIFDNPLGIITNAPTYDWHMINLRNYINLSAVAIPAQNIKDLDFTRLSGSGLPGDFTPPSRFVRAVAWSQTARELKDSEETIYELFRILDNFNVPLGSAEGSDNEDTNLNGMRSATIWTTAWDLKNKILYFHTQHNRRVRKVELQMINFFKLEEINHIQLDDDPKKQDIKDITPAN